jgi:VanZ family protein
MKIKYIYPFIWLGFIVFASLTPSDKLPDFKLFKHADKVIHFCMYFGLSILLIPVFLKRQKYKTSYLITLLIALFFGLLMEYLQPLISRGRSAEFADFAANAVGVISGIVVYQLLIRNKKLEKVIFKIE